VGSKRPYLGPSPQVRGYLCLVGTREFGDLLIDRLSKDWNPRTLDLLKEIQRHEQLDYKL